MAAGIDYGLGRSNIDRQNGIRYGVIAIRSLHEWIYEELENEYPAPCCPSCGREVTKAFRCTHCRKTWDDYKCTEGLEPIGASLSSSTYTASSAFDMGCLFLTKSPYFTYCVFCSPCAPGAGDLDHPIEDGAKTYCFGHEMFDGNKAPYPVYRVDTGEQVMPE